MLRFLLVRTAAAIPIVFAILIVNFLIIHLAPGDPVQALVGDYPTPPGYVEKVRHDFGLDEPLGRQLGLYLWNLAGGNLGFSFANRQPVLGLLILRAVPTLLLMLPALTLASLVGLGLALLAAPRVGGATDFGITALSLAGYSIPVFWLGQLLVILFAVDLHWLPAQGMVSLRSPPTGWGAVQDIVLHMALPLLSVTIYYVAIVARVARASLAEALNQDYVLTAKAKGLSSGAVLRRHVLPNSLIPVVTVIGYNFGYALTGAILVETVFAWPGIGSLFLTSVGNRDHPVLQGIFLLTALTVVIANVLTDALYGLLDPRVRRGGLSRD